MKLVYTCFGLHQITISFQMLHLYYILISQLANVVTTLFLFNLDCILFINYGFLSLIINIIYIFNIINKLCYFRQFYYYSSIFFVKLPKMKILISYFILFYVLFLLCSFSFKTLSFWIDLSMRNGNKNFLLIEIPKKKP